MHIDRAIEDFVFALANFFEELVARPDASARAGQAKEEIEFHRCEIETMVVDGASQSPNKIGCSP